MNKKRVGEENPGDAIGSQQQYLRHLVKIGEALTGFERVLDMLADQDEWVYSIRAKLADEDNRETLIIVKAMVGGSPVVGFHSAEGFGEAVRGTIARLSNRTMKWKEDEYEAQNRGASSGTT